METNNATNQAVPSIPEPIKFLDTKHTITGAEVARKCGTFTIRISGAGMYTTNPEAGEVELEVGISFAMDPQDATKVIPTLVMREHKAKLWTRVHRKTGVTIALSGTGSELGEGLTTMLDKFGYVVTRQEAGRNSTGEVLSARIQVPIPSLWSDAVIRYELANRCKLTTVLRDILEPMLEPFLTGDPVARKARASKTLA